MRDVPCAVRMCSKVRMRSSETCVKTFENDSKQDLRDCSVKTVCRTHAQSQQD